MKLASLIKEDQQTLLIKKNDISFNKSRNTFAAEISQLGNFFPSRSGTVKLKNEKTGGEMIFKFDHIDHDPENEVAGWWYKSEDGKYKLLIIND
jgi:hypothetical protein